MTRLVARRVSGVASSLALASPAYLLLLLISASRPSRRVPTRAAATDVPLVVLIPAHNEELSIERAIRSVQATGYPKDKLEILVVADNCTDRTAEIAEESGATVIRRKNGRDRGKGFALEFGIAHARSTGRGRTVVVVDADCTVSRNFLTAIASAISEGAVAVQTNNEATFVDDSGEAQVRALGIQMMNRVRPEGKNRLGLSAGLSGSGMAFTQAALDVIDWGRPTLAEDVEQHAQLVLAGLKVCYRGDASVRSPLPVSLDGWLEQQMRWEAGRRWVTRRYAPKLITLGIIRMSPQTLVTGLDLVIPPQSVMAFVSTAAGGLGWVTGSVVGKRLAMAALSAQAAFVLGGLIWMRAPTTAFLSLMRAPQLVARKLRLHAQITHGGAVDRAWVRAERSGPVDHVS
jgi:hypothetical protein